MIAAVAYGLMAVLERWVDEAATRSADYELIGWDGPVPDEHLDRWVDLVHVIRDEKHDAGVSADPLVPIDEGVIIPDPKVQNDRT